MPRTITIHLLDGDHYLKDMVKDLRRQKCDGNQYYGLSESVIVKRILDKPLAEEHKRITTLIAKGNADQ